ncbi:MAG: hypothetical protein L0Z62_11965 [Gemmataceae bacterium]|nr:hypothetical protein [Gemmataceae bacterium]
MQHTEATTPKATTADTLETLVTSAGDLSAAARSRLREDLRLQLEYPDRYVAYLDTWSGRGEAQCLRRQVVADAHSLPELHARLAELPAEVRAKATLEYVLDPNGPLDLTGHLLNP